jgi:hypothetical protein
MSRPNRTIVGQAGLAVSLSVLLAAACDLYNENLLAGARAEKGAVQGSGGDGTGGAVGATGGMEGGADAAGGEASSTGGAGGKSGLGGRGGSGGNGAGTGGTENAGAGGSGGNGGSSGKGGDASGGVGAGGKAGAAGSSAGTAGTEDIAGTSGAGGSTGGNGGSDAGGNGGSAASAGACGVCGCGMPETDTDADGVPDCNDACPGFSDTDCSALEDGLVHRYSFGGTGTQVRDSKGTAHGTAINATLTDTGTLTLTGGNTSSPPYVNLPNGLISPLSNATLETWVRWNQSGTTGQDWQRIFDFGTTGTEDMQVTTGTASMSYVFLCPRVGSTPSVLRGGYTTSGFGGETTASAAAPLARGSMQHIVLVLDDTNNQLALYLNGAIQGQAAAFTGALADVSDVNNWLGRSSHSADYEFIGVFDEFRIYDTALTAAQISTSFMAGPNPVFL